VSEKSITLNVTGMSCNGCRTSVERSLQKLDGVQTVSVSLNPAEAIVSFDADRLTIEDLKARVVAAGYGVA
jgi:copper chaperone CopZ